MSKIHKLKLLPFAAFQALLFMLLGFVSGIIYAIGGLFVDILVTINIISPVVASTPGLSVGSILAMGALVGMPAIGAVVGFATGLLEAVLFNIFTKIFGGMNIDFIKKNTT